MRNVTLGEVLDLHRRVIEQSGAAFGVRDLDGAESAVAQPQMTFGGDGCSFRWAMAARRSSR